MEMGGRPNFMDRTWRRSPFRSRQKDAPAETSALSPILQAADKSAQADTVPWSTAPVKLPVVPSPNSRTIRPAADPTGTVRPPWRDRRSTASMAATGAQHLGLVRRPVGLHAVAPVAREHDVLPARPAAAALGNHMVERQLVAGERVPTISAAPLVTEQHVVAGERRRPRHRHVLAQGDHARQGDRQELRPRRHQLILDHAHPVLEDGVNRVLPAPDRQREAAQGPKIAVQHEGWVCARATQRRG